MRFLIKVDFIDGSHHTGSYWRGVHPHTRLTRDRKEATVFTPHDLIDILSICKHRGINFKHIAKLIPLH